MPVTLGTPTINHIISLIKQNKVNDLLASLNGSRIAQLLACHLMELSIQCEDAANQTVDQTDLNQAVKMTKKEEIDAFSLLENNMHLMTQSLMGVMGPTCLIA